MPELPEVETVRRTLAGQVVGRRVQKVQIHRAEVVRGDLRGEAVGLLEGDRIREVLRLGKQLAVVGDHGGVACVHLGMTGSLCCGSDKAMAGLKHVHVVWEMGKNRRMWFRDPRRFGGIWGFASEEALWGQRWNKLGPDATLITPAKLQKALNRTRRALKAALLDQQVVAGLGNIYVDELLFVTHLHPEMPADAVNRALAARMVRSMRRILEQAVNAGGSTLRDYVDAQGQAGGYQNQHKVYGRKGLPCRVCDRTLEATVVAGRTTVSCPVCQPREGGG